MNMVIPAARAAKKAFSGVKLVRSPIVAKHFSPSNTEPKITNIEIRIIAVRYLIILAATPVPNMLAESLLPNVQPKNIPEITLHMLYNSSRTA